MTKVKEVEKRYNEFDADNKNGVEIVQTKSSKRVEYEELNNRKSIFNRDVRVDSAETNRVQSLLIDLYSLILPENFQKVQEFIFYFVGNQGTVTHKIKEPEELTNLVSVQADNVSANSFLPRLAKVEDCSVTYSSRIIKPSVVDMCVVTVDSLGIDYQSRCRITMNLKQRVTNYLAVPR